MKSCELCSNPARIYCEADGASLCSDCDDKVHSANFIVAKHLRNLLCQICQSQTPWKASGTKLGPTVSVCSACAENSASAEKQRQGRTEGDETDVEFEEGEEFSDDEDLSSGNCSEDEDDEEEGDNQVVPWSFTSPVPSSSTSSSEAISSSAAAGGGGGGFSALKRTRGDADLDLDSELSEDEELSSGSDEDDEEGGDNQVVPWSFTRPVPNSSTSSSEAMSSCGVSSAGGGGGGGGESVSALKRSRGDADLDSEDEIGCISLRFNCNIASTAMSSPALENDKSNSSGFFRSVRSLKDPMKQFDQRELKRGMK